MAKPNDTSKLVAMNAARRFDNDKIAIGIKVDVIVYVIAFPAEFKFYASYLSLSDIYT